MTLLQGDPGNLTLYTSVDLSPDIRSVLERDFALGAHEGNSPLCRLSISERNDLRQCKQPEDVLRILEKELPDDAEGYIEDFLYANESTLKYGQEGVVWYVSGWAKEDDYEKDDLAEGVDESVIDGHYKFANKQLVYINYAPVLYANLCEANLSISESFEFPYDPYAEPKPDQGGMDWRFEPPNPAQVIADASQYDSRTISEHNKVAEEGDEMMDEEDLEKEGCMMYRLKEGVAAKMGLKASWSLGKKYDTWVELPEETREEIEKEIHDRETAVEFSQEWDWSPPTGIAERIIEEDEVAEAE